MRRAALLAAAGLAALLVTPAEDAGARPGGGQSFSSSSGASRGSSYGSSGGSSWGSGRSSSGSSWGSSSSSHGSSSSSWGSSGSSSPGTSPGSYGPGVPYGVTSGETERQLDESQCVMDCSNEEVRRILVDDPDGGAFDRDACQRSCVARKSAERRAASAPLPGSSSSTDSSAGPPPEPPLSRKLLPLTLLLGIVATGAGVSYGIRRRKEREWATWARGADEQPGTVEEQQRYASVGAALAAVGAADEGFSRVLFEDFLYALYAEVHVARGGGHLARLAPYLGDRARAALARLPADAVEGLIVGSATVREVRVDRASRVVRASVVFEANYTERQGGAERSYYAHEEWALERAADTPSRPPERARVIGCANCGAPLDKLVGGTCRHCGAPPATATDWRVVDVAARREERGPILTGTTEEQGTDDPTLVAPDVKPRWAELCARDPAVTWASLCARVGVVFQTFHRTWTAQDLTDVRPFLSDLLFETQRYWVEAYEAQELRNVTEDPTIVTIQLSRVVRDPYFDAVTVRVFATCKDYTVDRDGKVVGGRRSEERRYTEYWTFIRGADRKGAARTDAGCPGCGAPVGSIGMAGKCASCGVKVTTGDFDWILSRIEQDEAYALS